MFERIVLPNGMELHYHNLHQNKEGDWIFSYGRELKKLYGGKNLENCSQSLCRIIVMQVAYRVRRRLETEFMSHLVMQGHDALTYSVPDDHVPDVVELLREEMKKPPVWWPGIPLNCEVKTGKCYGTAKEWK
jgi:hypothetical protein